MLTRASIAQVQKGWVREAIINLLSRNPEALTELSTKLGVSKATVSYHLSTLQDKEIVEVAEVSVGRGGIESKKFRIRANSIVMISKLDEEKDQLRKLAELFEVAKLAWTTPGRIITG